MIRTVFADEGVPVPNGSDVMIEVGTVENAGNGFKVNLGTFGAPGASVGQLKLDRSA